MIRLLNAFVNHACLGIGIIFSFFFWIIANAYYPGVFDPFRYLLLTNDIPSAVLNCWPLFLYCIIVTMIFYTLRNNFNVWRERDRHKGKTLAIDIYTSVMAGLLEEIGFRGVFIFIGMACIAVTDYLLFGVSSWFVQNITLPIADILTLGMIHNVLYGFPLLFIGGALAANCWFRDGHKYLGTFGYINSWFVGLYLMVVMLTQGLIVAIIVHATYDLLIAFMNYGFNCLDERADNCNRLST